MKTTTTADESSPVLRRQIGTLLVANRGEIARRVMRTARAMGIRTVAIYSDPDRDSPHVREADVAVAVGGSTASESYLRIDAILDAARRSGADAIHPGYGFLSENALFAEAVAAAGLVFVGPTAANIRAMGGKIEAKQLAEAAGVPTLPSVVVTGDDAQEWARVAGDIGYPVLVKATAGGGGKGMRIVAMEAELAEAITGARREAASSFGDATVFLEKYLPAPRHIEIQVFGDLHGNVIHLHERECSIQRRHQKIIEEAPSPVLSPDMRAQMGAASVALAKSIGYVGAGTMEFLYDDMSGAGSFFFLEMNTRLQVEHPVTECITGLDLVRWQLLVAQGEPLPIAQDDVPLHGAAIEVRLYAEDPSNDFLPTFGMLHDYAVTAPGLTSTPGVRVDDGVERGSFVSTFYDPMLAKVIAHAPTRREAAGRLRRALSSMALHGVVTNREYLVGILGEPDYLRGATTTAYVGQHPALLGASVDAAPLSDTALRSHLVAAVLVGSLQRRRCDVRWGFASAGWRNLRSQRLAFTYRLPRSETPDASVVLTYEWTDRRNEGFVVGIDGTDATGRVLRVDTIDPHTDTVTIDVDGITHTITVRVLGEHTWVNSIAGQSEFVEVPRFPDSSLGAAAHGPMAPVPGRVVVVSCAAGDRVEAGQTLVVMEAMKMEHRIEAAAASTVREVLCAVGDQVDAHQVLVALDPID